MQEIQKESAYKRLIESVIDDNSEHIITDNSRYTMIVNAMAELLYFARKGMILTDLTWLCFCQAAYILGYRHGKESVSMPIFVVAEKEGE